mgnify:CR=1 FL=1
MDIRKPSSPALQLYRKLPPVPNKATPVVSQMLGNPKAKVLMIAPPCGERGYQENLPMVAPFELFLIQMMEEKGIYPTDDFLTVSCSRWGLKPNKASTADIQEFVMHCGKARLFPLFVCVGGTAFSYVFGGGRKTSMKTLGGSTLHLRELPEARLFVLPDPEPLVPVLSGERKDFREDAFRVRCQEEALTLFDRHLLILKGLL